MNKRVCCRAVIIKDGFVYLMYREKMINGQKITFYTYPGGGVEENETLEETVIREVKEEFNLDVIINKFLKTIEREENITHYFSCKIIGGDFKLSGEEKLRNSEDNYYEVKKVSLNEISKIDLYSKELINESLN